MHDRPPAAVPRSHQASAARVETDGDRPSFADAALLESEERFHQLADHVNAVFWITDLPTRRVIYISSGVERLWQLDHGRLMQGQRGWIGLIHPDDRDRVEDAFLAAFLSPVTQRRRLTRSTGCPAR